ncbi:MAG: TrmJ/YjtD family RNA methyltransferase [Alphaproteobacteria bacterium]|nr:TrmJ/YjtD family RNA methyltransferase [Alphaproteobacteria bacterium]
MKGPAFILSHPQLGENIGAAARAMLNFGLTDLRLIRPREAWPNKKAEAMAVGAVSVLEGARVFQSIEEAVADLGLVFATTGRDRLMSKRVATPDEAVPELAAEIAQDRKCGVLFGAERMGLTNEEVVLADAILTVPTNPKFASLNLAQSVAVVAYEWWKGTHDRPEFKVPAKFRRAKPANKEDLIGFFEHIEGELDRTEFLFPPDKRAAMVQNMRNMWQRAGLTYQEVQTLRGMVRALTGGKKRRKKGET